MQPSEQNSALSAADLEAAYAFAIAHREELPDAVYRCLLFITTLHNELSAAKKKASDLVRQLRVAMGILPKSERGARDVHAKDGVQAADDAAAIERLKLKLKALNRQLRRYHSRRKVKAAKKPITSTTEPDTSDGTFAKTTEAVFNGAPFGKGLSQELSMQVDRDRHFDAPKGLHTSTDERSRYEVSVSATKLTLKVETVTDPRTGKSVTASTDEIGPPNSQSTWKGIANVILVVIGYAVPANRLAAMLSETMPYFTTARILKMLSYAAELFAPIYEYLGSSLADVDVLNGDDTTARVIETERELDKTTEPPAAKGVAARMAEVFGRFSKIKSGERYQKEVNVSVLIGKTEASDPHSYVFFFRTHVGRLGNLLGEILKQRSPRKKELTLQTDLSTANYPEKSFYQRFRIRHAGCGAHARRPFWRYRDDDQELCYWMLHAFLILEGIEDKLDALGRTKEKILHYRQKYARKIWHAMRLRCESVMRGEKKYSYYWPKTSKLYGACQYIVANYPELTRYLDDPRLSSTNNVSERALRWDKIMEDSSGFRVSELGRVNIDILRTILSTCTAAEVDLTGYLLFVFKNREQIKTDPQNYTPYAYSKICSAQPAGSATH